MKQKRSKASELLETLNRNQEVDSERSQLFTKEIELRRLELERLASKRMPKR